MRLDRRLLCAAVLLAGATVGCAQAPVPPAPAAGAHASPSSGRAPHGVVVEAAAGTPAPSIRQGSRGIEISGERGRVRFLPGNPVLPFDDAAARLEIELAPAAVVRVGKGEHGRPEIRVVIQGARTVEAPPVRVRAGRFVAAIGVRGRLSLERGARAHTVPAALVVEVADPGARLFPSTVKGPWHVVTFLTKNQVSDLDSRYWLGGPGSGSDRIQFSTEEYRQLGVDFERLLAERLTVAGRSGSKGQGDPVRLIPPASAAIAALVKECATRGQVVRFSDVRSGFRSYEDQERSWNNNVKEPYGPWHQRTGLLVHDGALVAVPGYSQHGTGGAVDFSLANAEDVAFREAALEHGFIRSEMRHPWKKGGFVKGWVDRPHFLYIGHDLEAVPYFPSPEQAASGN